MNVLIIDNYDSFTYNLYHLLLKFGLCLSVRRNDAIEPEEIRVLSPDMIVVSPGPKNPSESGNTKWIITEMFPEKPILGVCLGMQAINEVFGGKTVHAPQPVHGKTSRIYHQGDAIFQGLPSPFSVARYHSLISTDIPECLRIVASTEDRIPMAFIHRELPVCGVQYHPESFLSQYGFEVIQNFLAIVEAYDSAKRKSSNLQTETAAR